MPRLRRRGHKLRGELSADQLLDLILGAMGAFPSDAERRAAWESHREVVIAECNALSRPQAWWDYDSPEPRNGQKEYEQINRMGVLRDDEQPLLEWMKWRGLCHA